MDLKEDKFFNIVTTMSQQTDSFFTSIGCMDGRVQAAVSDCGKEKFGAKFPDTITEAGMDGLLAHTDERNFYESVTKKIAISVDKHHSQGIIIHGHEDCAGNPVDEMQHKMDIRRCVEIVKKIVEGKGIDVVGVYVKVSPTIQLEEV